MADPAKTYRGRTCKNDHDGGLRWRSDGGCVECTRERQRNKNMTPEQIERKRARNRVENMTPEEIERERTRERRENMTPDQIERKRARERVANMTPEQLARLRELERAAYHRRYWQPGMAGILIREKRRSRERIRRLERAIDRGCPKSSRPS
jgi:hypothetical protein